MRTVPDNAAIVVHVSGAGNIYMTEIAEQLAASAGRLGRGGELRVDDLPADDGHRHLVVAPHEFFVLHPVTDPERLRAAAARSLCVNVEQPGTTWFEIAAEWISLGVGCLDINDVGAAELRRRDIAARRLHLGYDPGRDRWLGHQVTRSVDLVYLGDDSPRRMAALGARAELLASHRSELRVFAVEGPVRPGRPGFLMADSRTDLLASSRVLLNVHRSATPYFEWVRLLDAIANGCVVVSEPSTDLGPLRPGVHLLEAPPGDLVSVACALLADEDRRAEMARAAHDVLRVHLDATALLADALAGLEGDLPPATRPVPGRRSSDVADQSDESDGISRDVGGFAGEPTVVPAGAHVASVRRSVLDGDAPPAVELGPPGCGRSGTARRRAVAVLTRDQADTIVAAVRSALTVVGDDGEVLVADAGSTDGTVRAVERFAAERPWAPLRVLSAWASTSIDDAVPLIREAGATELLVMDGATVLHPDALDLLSRHACEAGAGSAAGIGHRHGSLAHPAARPPEPIDGVPWPTLLLRLDDGDPDRLAFLHQIVAEYR